MLKNSQNLRIHILNLIVDLVVALLLSLSGGTDFELLAALENLLVLVLAITAFETENNLTSGLGLKRDKEKHH